MKKLLNTWYDPMLPWIETHGLKIAIVLVIAFVVNKVIHKFIERTVRIMVRPEDGIDEQAVIQG